MELTFNHRNFPIVFKGGSLLNFFRGKRIGFGLIFNKDMMEAEELKEKPTISIDQIIELDQFSYTPVSKKYLKRITEEKFQKEYTNFVKKSWLVKLYLKAI